MNTQVLKQVGLALVTHIRASDWAAFRVVQVKAALKLLNILLLPLGLLFVPVIRAMRPWLLVRIGILTSERIGHFAANTELYLCERDAGINIPKKRYVDLWYHNWPISNRQLARMWGRVLHIAPAWLMAPVNRMNSLIPGGSVHQIGENAQIDRDVCNLLDRFPPHLSFLPNEEKPGELGLRALGIPVGAPFVCLNVRDSAYLRHSIPWRNWDYHDYRDSNIQNYTAAALALTELGYYVVRMGAVVKEAMNVSHPMIIDYAISGKRSDFMDIYLEAKCAFCIGTGSGLDAVPLIFRRPICFVNHVPLQHLVTYANKALAIIKGHWLRDQKRFMSFREIIKSGAGIFMYSRQFEGLGIELVENTPAEIRAVALEMVQRLRGARDTTDEDEELQRRFWEIFPRDEWHGEIRSRIGAAFLRANKAWLQ